jgi:hypothetical protein
VDFVLRKFFELVDGRYVQARIAEEIAEYRKKAVQNKTTACEREAARREGKGTGRARNVQKTAPNQEPRTSNQEPEESSEPSGHQQHGGPPGGPDGPARPGSAEPQSPGSPADGPVQQAAAAMQAAGLADVSASHPKLLALVAAGITTAELADAAAAAVRGGRGFPWALGRAEGQRRDAAQVGALPAAAPAVDPESREAIETDGVRFGLGRWQALDDATGQHVPFAAYAAKVRAARGERGGVPA